ncbi:MAG: hypothetical protein JNM52_09985, partial [Betaproteobacteria bacterium]|nr:hypothetical protein [Betaproteobacteria bacterium]
MIPVDSSQRPKLGLNAVAAALAAALLPQLASALSLGNAEVRSYLGESLLVRIPVLLTEGEDIDSGCLSVINSFGPSYGDLQIKLVEMRNSRYIEVRSRSTNNEPIVQLQVRAKCAGTGMISREYPLLIDPPPAYAPAISPAESARVEGPPGQATNPRGASVTPSSAPPPLPASSVTSPPKPGVASSAGALKARSKPAQSWTVQPGDTLETLAKSVFPTGPARRARYIKALRALNADLGAIADNAALTPDTVLTLPDLKTFPPSRPSTATANFSISGNAPAPQSSPTPPARPEPAPRPASLAAAPKSKPDAGFKLQISGSTLDLSRSQGVSEETRAALRQKQTLLDADDQVAALLELKNTVRQLEKRLNELQLKMATDPKVIAAAPTSPAPVTSPADNAPPYKPDIAVPTDSPSITPTVPPVGDTTSTPINTSAPPAADSPRTTPAAQPKPIERN